MYRYMIYVYNIIIIYVYIYRDISPQEKKTNSSNQALSVEHFRVSVSKTTGAASVLTEQVYIGATNPRVTKELPESFGAPSHRRLGCPLPLWQVICFIILAGKNRLFSCLGSLNHIEKIMASCHFEGVFGCFQK